METKPFSGRETRINIPIECQTIERLYPNPYHYHKLQRDPVYPHQVYTVGHQVSMEQYREAADILLLAEVTNASTQIHISRNKINISSRLVGIIPFIMPVLIDYSSIGHGSLQADYISDTEYIPTHADVGIPEFKRYIMTNIDNLTTQTVNHPQYYFNEDGSAKDLLQQIGGNAVREPMLQVNPAHIWQTPALTFIAMCGTTLHMRPEGIPGRGAIIISSLETKS